MKYRALCCDYDGTLAYEGRVAERTFAALDQVRSSGRRVILVTGRIVNDLRSVCPQLGRFDCVVAENGGVLYWPSRQASELLGTSLPERFILALQEAGIEFQLGQVILATSTRYEKAVRATISCLDLRCGISLNKGALMVLPAGLNKGTGLALALERLGIPLSEAIGIGDAENDLELLDGCGWAVAVANALPAVKDKADIITSGSYGEGVVELIDRLFTEDRL